jgi:hypothetical protein
VGVIVKKQRRRKTRKAQALYPGEKVGIDVSTYEVGPDRGVVLEQFAGGRKVATILVPLDTVPALVTLIELNADALKEGDRGSGHLANHKE